MTRSPSSVGPGLKQIAGGAIVALVATALAVGTLMMALGDMPGGDSQPTQVAEATSAPTLVVLPTSPPEPDETPTSTPVLTQPDLTPTATASPIPVCTPPTGWRPYWVQPGDTLTDLAAQSGLSVSMLAQANCLDGSSVQPGSVIYLPPVSSATSAPTIVRCGPPPNWVLYRVRRGDTLYNLSRRTGVSMQSIMFANCMGPGEENTLFVNQPLYLPIYPPTLTPTATATVPSATPTSTETPTFTPTPQPSSTPSPSPSATTPPTPVPTSTPTETVPPTATFTVVPPTATSTITPTMTSTPVPTATTPVSGTVSP